MSNDRIERMDSVPDRDKVAVPQGELAVEETWDELTGNRGDDDEQ